MPRFAKAGLPGEEHDVILELKLLADVGLVGFPNVGKSMLLSVTSNAHPKIANYHFTTLYPNLGVIYVADGVSFVMADIPGIIEGAADGVGLGHDFLRHIDRCRLLVHIVDVSGSEDRDPVDDFEKINEELRQYSPELAERPMLVAANKVDLLPPDSDNLERLRAHVEAKGYEFYTICAATTRPSSCGTISPSFPPATRSRRTPSLRRVNAASTRRSSPARPMRSLKSRASGCSPAASSCPAAAARG